jgi:predicted RNA-binding protein with PUA-like domain
MVDIAFVEKLPRVVPLSELKADPALEGMVVTGKSRLSVQPVEQQHFDRIVALAREEGA